MAETPIREATVIRPGDHLIVRIEDTTISRDSLAAIKHELLERLPQLGSVTFIVGANGLAVFRDEVDHG